MKHPACDDDEAERTARSDLGGAGGDTRFIDQVERGARKAHDRIEAAPRAKMRRQRGANSARRADDHGDDAGREGGVVSAQMLGGFDGHSANSSASQAA